MTDDRDPGLLQLFDTAKGDVAGEEFVARVMERIDAQRRRAIIGWLAAAVLFVPVLWWLSTPVMGAVDLATQILPRSLIEMDNEWMAQLISPINSVAGVTALIFLGLRSAYKKIFT